MKSKVPKLLMSSLRKCGIIRIGPDRAYPLHFTHPELLLLPVFLSLLCISGMELGWNLFLLVFQALSFEMITFQSLIFGLLFLRSGIPRTN